MKEKCSFFFLYFWKACITIGGHLFFLSLNPSYSESFHLRSYFTLTNWNMNFGYNVEEFDDSLPDTSHKAFVVDGDSKAIHRKRAVDSKKVGRWAMKRCYHFHELYTQCLDETKLFIPFFSCTKESSMFSSCISQMKVCWISNSLPLELDDSLLKELSLIGQSSLAII